MTPFLIRTRTGAPARSIIIWAVISESEIDARSAVAGVVAAGWTVEDVIGTATLGHRLINRIQILVAVSLTSAR
jgi:hypothetical protein